MAGTEELVLMRNRKQLNSNLETVCVSRFSLNLTLKQTIVLLYDKIDAGFCKELVLLCGKIDADFR